MRMLQLEASNGWGGQEIRTLQEARHMREKGHEVIFAVTKGGLLNEANAAGFKTYIVPFEKKLAPFTLLLLLWIIITKRIETIHTHSSWDSWMGGIAGRLTFRPIFRTRHLSTAIKPGLNSRLLYKTLANYVITTCQEVAINIKKQSGSLNCTSIPTGVNPDKIVCQIPSDFRKEHCIPEDAFLIGSACILRSWKGLMTLLESVALSEKKPYLVIIGEGPMRPLLEKRAKELKVLDRVRFTGFLKSPYTAIKALDLFALLSTSNEGVSQATLQAAYLEKPLLTTPTGGLKEVCLHDQTGLIVPINDTMATTQAINSLIDNRDTAKTMGLKAKELVLSKFLWSHTIEALEKIYRQNR